MDVLFHVINSATEFIRQFSHLNLDLQLSSASHHYSEIKHPLITDERIYMIICLRLAYKHIIRNELNTKLFEV